MSLERRGFFSDMDGTLRDDEEGFSKQILKGIERVQQAGVITTIVTGRGYPRFKYLIGSYLDSLISDSAPVSLENGARMSPRNGDKNLKHYPLSVEEIRFILEQCRVVDFKYISYFPQNIKERGIMWTPDRYLIPDLTYRYGMFYDIKSDPLIQLEARMTRDKPGLFSMQLVDLSILDEIHANFLRANMNISTNERSMLMSHEGINKGSGVTDLSDMLDVPLEQILVAGNNQNDIPMFLLPDVRSVIIGNALEGMVTLPEAFYYGTPSEFGDHLPALFGISN